MRIRDQRIYWTAVLLTAEHSLFHFPGKTMLAKADSGTLTLHHYHSEKFEITYLHCLPVKDFTIELNVTIPCIAFVTSLKDNLQLSTASIDKVTILKQQYNVYSVGSDSVKLSYQESREQLLFIASLTPTVFDAFIGHSPKLSQFLDNRSRKGLSTLFRRPRYLPMETGRIIEKISNCPVSPELVSFYFNSLVDQLIAVMVFQANSSTEDLPLSPSEIAAAQKVYNIITSNFETYYSVKELALIAKIKVSRLQVAFKVIYGVTVAKFSLNARMERSYELLCSTDYPLRVICTMVGFEEPSNFSIAFRNHFGCTPGSVKRHKK